MEPNEKQTIELSKWNGERINLKLLHHEKYNLSMFISNMNNWKGNILCIGYSGPDIFTEQVAKSFNNPSYKQLYLNNCTLPDNFINLINKYAPYLHCIQINDE